MDGCNACFLFRLLVDLRNEWSRIEFIGGDRVDKVIGGIVVIRTSETKGLKDVEHISSVAIVENMSFANQDDSVQELEYLGLRLMKSCDNGSRFDCNNILQTLYQGQRCGTIKARSGLHWFCKLSLAHN